MLDVPFNQGEIQNEKHFGFGQYKVRNLGI